VFRGYTGALLLLWLCWIRGKTRHERMRYDDISEVVGVAPGRNYVLVVWVCREKIGRFCSKERWMIVESLETEEDVEKL